MEAIVHPVDFIDAIHPVDFIDAVHFVHVVHEVFNEGMLMDG